MIDLKHGQKTELARAAGVTLRTVLRWYESGCMPMNVALRAQLMFGVPAVELMSADDAALFVACIKQRKEKICF